MAMLPNAVPILPSTIPDSGTTAAIELGCTCRSIAHTSAVDEREPAGMLMVPDPNCPLHGSTPLSQEVPIV
jgi:hypothetical protein